MVFGTSSVGRNLTATASGTITQTALPSRWAAAATLTPGAGSSVTLGNATNSFTGSVAVTQGTTVTLTDSATLDLGPISISANLSATSSSATGITNVGGALTIGATPFSLTTLAELPPA